jgi:hypothetical protein
VQWLASRADRESGGENVDRRCEVLPHPTRAVDTTTSEQREYPQAEESAHGRGDEQREAAYQDVAIEAAISDTDPRCDQQFGQPLDGERQDEQRRRGDVEVLVHLEETLVAPTETEDERYDDRSDQRCGDDPHPPLPTSVEPLTQRARTLPGRDR